MPISSNASAVDKKRTLKIVNKVLTPTGSASGQKKSQIPPQTIVIPNLVTSEPNYDASSVTLQTKSDGTICVYRTDKDVKIDRLNLDRCSLNKIPLVADDNNHLRLFSLQHNMISNLAINQAFPNLVFLDVYDNDIELIDTISTVHQLRVLLIGKNRLRKITGLSKLGKLEVLDLHGNQIARVSGLGALSKLKVLNLAGNRIDAIAEGELKGLDSLSELNLRRNSLKKINGFDDVVTLQKLYLSNNDIKRIDDMITIIKCLQLKDLTMENNPVSVTSDCVSFLVAQLPSLTSVNGIQVTENFRKTALVWKRNKLRAMTSAPLNGGREKVISNAKTNWELLRTQTKSLTAKETYSQFKYPPKSATKSMPSLKSRSTFNLGRANSLDTTESSSLSNAEHVCFPPIVISTETKDKTKLESDSSSSSCVSSNDPHVDIDSSLHLDDDDDDSSSDDNASDNVKDKSVIVEGTVVKTQIELDINKSVVPTEQITDSLVESRTIGVNDTDVAQDGASVVNAMPSSSDGTGSELSHSNSSIKSRRSVRSAFAASTLTRGRLGRRLIQPRAASVKVTKSRSPSTGSSTGFNSGGTAMAPTNNITYQGASILSTATNVAFGGGISGAAGDGGTCGRDREQGGDYLVEICGRHLNVYGQGALRHLDRAWSAARAADVTHVNFHYANYNGIAVVLPRIKHRFPNIAHLSFTGNSLTNLGQINALAEVHGLHAIVINQEGNPLVGNSKWRQYAIYRLTHWGLRTINGEEISVEEAVEANAEFRSLSDLVLYTLPGSVLEPLLLHLKLDSDDELISEGFSKRNLLLADPHLRSVITKEALQWKRSLNSQDEFALRQRSKNRISAIVEEMVHSEMKVRELERTWPSILKDIIRNSLLDYTQFDAYKKAKLQELI